ncbi:hypothetical protein ACFX13_021256 [Malus domestica]
MARNRGDCISRLQDEIISVHILTKLPINQAAATSILSRKWRNLWTLMPSVEINDQGEQEEQGEPGEEENRENAFYARMQGLLSHPAAAATPLQGFSLVCEEWTRAEEMTRLIRIALQDRRAKKLKVDVAPAWEGGNLILPDIVYTSPDLLALNISKVIVQMPAGAVFISLKSLTVDITHQSDPSLQNFYHRCPVLEELAFEGRIDEFPDVEHHFRVSSESLKLFSLRLHSDFNYEKYYDVDLDIYKFSIRAPKLKHLVLDENILASYAIEGSENLVGADISTGWDDDLSYPGATDLFLARVFKLMEGLKHIQMLELNERTMAALGMAFNRLCLIEDEGDQDSDDEEEHLIDDEGDQDGDDEEEHLIDDEGDQDGDEEEEHLRAEKDVWSLVEKKMGTFPLLTNLKLRIGNNLGWAVFPYLLKSCTALKSLVLEMVVMDGVEEGFAWNPPSAKPACLEESIERVQLRGFEEQGERVLQYFQEINGRNPFELIVL